MKPPKKSKPTKKGGKALSYVRSFAQAKRGAKSLGPLKLLPGEWVAKGTGWNMIALPYERGSLDFRVLMNQYNENLSFSFVDDNVPNRGLRGKICMKKPSREFDQFVVTLDYQQEIRQVVAEDRPKSGLAGDPGLAIHHEPGLWLYMKNLRTEGIDIARLSSIPHGNSVLALGRSYTVKGMPKIPPLSGMPLGPFEDILSSSFNWKKDKYLRPYKHYIENPFMGNVSAPGFPGFSPADMNAILNFANKGVKVKRTTVLEVDTEIEDGGISNIPFIVKQAEAVSMKSTFWIQELNKLGPDRKPILRMQYSQVVMLDFFDPRPDGLPGRIAWPHVSIATLVKKINT